MTRRRWWTWVLMWGSLLGIWMAFKVWAPKPPWFQDTAPLSALQPIPFRPLTPLGAPTDASPLRAEADIAAWAHLDSMDLDMPRTWQLQGNARAWFSLGRFFRTLPEASQQRVEVYHWGDSQIEGDRLTQVLRKSWQSRWGGRGPGWVLPIAPAQSTAIVGSTEGEVARRAGFGRGRDEEALRLPFFAVNDVADSMTWRVRGVRKTSPTHRGWSMTDVWGNPAAAFRLDPDLHASLATSGAWRHDAVHGDARLSFAAQSLQGVFLGSPHGVMVHNLPLRGSSGTLFDKTLEEDWEALTTRHPPSMVLLQFGGNAVPGIGSPKEARWYAQRLVQNIEHVQRRCPGAAIVFVGPSDMGQTSEDFPALTWVVQALRDRIPSTGALYWDLQAAMGGEGAMADWVQRGWASDDHVHFTRRGAEEAGQRLERALLRGWRDLLRPTSTHPDSP